MVEYSCKRAAEILIDNGTARQANGVTPLSMSPPPIFLGPPDLENRMPCSATRYPVVSMMKLDGCRKLRVADKSGTEKDLHICQP